MIDHLTLLFVLAVSVVFHEVGHYMVWRIWDKDINMKISYTKLGAQGQFSMLKRWQRVTVISFGMAAGFIPIIWSGYVLEPVLFVALVAFYVAGCGPDIMRLFHEVCNICKSKHR